MKQEKINSFIETLLSKSDTLSWYGHPSEFNCTISLSTGDKLSDDEYGTVPIKLSLCYRYLYDTPYDGSVYIILNASGVGEIARSKWPLLPVKERAEENVDALVRLYKKVYDYMNIKTEAEIKKLNIEREKRLEFLVSHIDEI